MQSPQNIISFTLQQQKQEEQINQINQTYDQDIKAQLNSSLSKSFQKRKYPPKLDITNVKTNLRNSEPNIFAVRAASKDQNETKINIQDQIVRLQNKQDEQNISQNGKDTKQNKKKKKCKYDEAEEIN